MTKYVEVYGQAAVLTHEEHGPIALAGRPIYRVTQQREYTPAASRAELEPAKKEFEQVDAAIKLRVAGVERVVCGEFLLLGKEVSKKGYAVKPSTYWQLTIQRIR